MITHLDEKHGIQSYKLVPPPQPTSRARPSSPPPLPDLLLYRERLLEWVVSDNVSFCGAASQKLHALLSLLHPSVNDIHPVSHNTVRGYVVDDFKEVRKAIRQELHTAISKISLSFDIWTAPNHLPFLGIEAHFVDRNGKLRNILIAFRLIYGAHTGENIASIVIDVITWYGIAHRIGWCTMDNASNNDTAADHIYSFLNKDWRHFRIRCAAHILNLAAKAGLYSKATRAGTKKARQTLTEADHRRVLEENEEVEVLMKQQHSPRFDGKTLAIQQQAARLRGPPGMIRNIANHVTSSYQRREAFKDAQRVAKDEDDETFRIYMLIKDSATRWNGTYEMIKRGTCLFCYLRANPSIS